MSRKFYLPVLLIATVVFCHLMAISAEAARLGGGRSFGSKPSFNRSAPAPTQAPSQFNTPRNQSQMPGAATTSPFGRWGGMLGGFMMGGLLGSLLFGGAHGYGGPGLMDLLLVGGGIFLLMRFLRNRGMAGAMAGPSAFSRSTLPGQEGAGSWGNAGAEPGWGAATPAAPPVAPTLPPGFDTAEFIEGAKAAYSRLQSSWDRRDLEDIRSFTTPEVWAEIKRQADEDPQPGKTELVLVNASLVEAHNESGFTEASVLYDVLMRENTQEKHPRQVRELWHFRREADRPGSFWRLQGIQQLEG